VQENSSARTTRPADAVFNEIQKKIRESGAQAHMSLTKKPINPMSRNPVAVANVIFLNSAIQRDCHSALNPILLNSPRQST